MRKLMPLAALCGLSLTACVSVGDRSLQVSPATTLVTQTGSGLVLDLPSSQVRIRPSDDDMLHATAVFFCDPENQRCLKNAERAAIVHEQKGDASYLSFEPGSAYSTRHADIEVTVEVPSIESLRVKVAAGDIDIESPTACVTARTTAGDLSIRAPLESAGSVHLDANVGDAELRTPSGEVFNDRSMLVGAEVHWDEGPGPCELSAKLTAGAIGVTLTDAR